MSSKKNNGGVQLVNMSSLTDREDSMKPSAVYPAEDTMGNNRFFLHIDIYILCN